MSAPNQLFVNGEHYTFSADDGMTHKFLILQLADSAYPTGGFSHSLGYEAAVQHCTSTGVKNHNGTPNEFTKFVFSCLENAGSLQLPYLRCAYLSESIIDVEQLDVSLHARLTNHVANRASMRQGRAFVNVASEIVSLPSLQQLCVLIEEDSLVGHYSVMFGYVCRHLCLTMQDTVDIFMYGVLRTIVASAVRLGKLGSLEVYSSYGSCLQTISLMLALKPGAHAQKLQYEIQQVIPNIVERYRSCSVEDACVRFPVPEYVQSTHDTMFARLFHS